MATSRRQVLASLAGGLMAGRAAAAEPIEVTLGTATPGGGFPVYGEALAAAVNTADPGLAVRTRPTRGSAENIPLLESGALDIALVQGEAAYEALNGIGRPRADLYVLAAMYPSPGMFAVRADSPAHRIADLPGKPVAFGTAGSGLVILARYVLDGLGLDMRRDFTAIFLDHAGEGPSLVADGRAAALWGGGIGWPGFIAVGRLPGRFIVPDADEIARIQAKHPFLKAAVIPAGSYPGQDGPLTSVGSWSLVLTRRDLDDRLAERLARALHRAEPDLARRLPQAAETTARNTVAALPRPELLHPGVARYFRSIGLLP